MERIDFTKYKRREPKNSPVATIVDEYCKAKGIERAIRVSKKLQEEYPYKRMAGRAARLLEDCGGKLGDAVFAVTMGNYFL